MNEIYIHYLSDVHLEFYDDKVNFEEIPTVKKVFDKIEKDFTNILVLCGDIGHPTRSNYRDFLLLCSCMFDHVLVIKGNHEYYCKLDHQELDELIKKVCDEAGAIFLNNSEWCFRGKVKFLGTTLWSKINRNGYKFLNDKFFCYKTLKEANEMHSNSLIWLQEKIPPPEDESVPIIIITHHLPSIKCIHTIHRRFDYVNNAYATDLEYMMKDPVKAWFFGHTHAPIENNINGVFVACNPSGYPDEMDKKFLETPYEPFKLVV